MPKDQNKCPICATILIHRKYGMGYINDQWICHGCGHVHESNKSTWIDIDGTEHEVML